MTTKEDRRDRHHFASTSGPAQPFTLYYGIGFRIVTRGEMYGDDDWSGGGGRRVNIQTVRYYERRGLMARPARTRSGYRQYGDDTVARLRFIKRAQMLGFSLHEIQELLELRVQHASACGTIEAKTEQKIELVDNKIAEARPLSPLLSWGSPSLCAEVKLRKWREISLRIDMVVWHTLPV